MMKTFDWDYTSIRVKRTVLEAHFSRLQPIFCRCYCRAGTDVYPAPTTCVPVRKLNENYRSVKASERALSSGLSKYWATVLRPVIISTVAVMPGINSLIFLFFSILSGFTVMLT